MFDIKTTLQEKVQELVEKLVGSGVTLNDKLPKATQEKYLSKVDDAIAFAKHNVKVNKDANFFVEFYEKMALEASSELDMGSPIFEYIAGTMQLEAEKHRLRKYRNDKHGYKFSFYELQKYLSENKLDATEKGESVFARYTKEEIEEAGTWINPEKDKEFKLISVVAFMTSYSEVNGDKVAVSLPQERYLTIALYLVQNEKENRMEKAKQLFWHLLNQTISPATPIMSNANRSGQLSSCFIDTTADNLKDIYGSNKDMANVSKNGGGIGVYMGKVRARGSSIQGVPGVSSGTLPWIKQLNNTAVSVDQLGQRQGAIAVYLDIWHKDLLTFLDLKLNNGDERLRAHDIFPALSIPDLFMEKLEARESWYLFDPFEVEKVMGFRLEDSYDEEKGNGEFRRRYQMCVENEELDKVEIPAIEIAKRYLRSQFETGTPFMFYRDTANRMNPNKHEGMIYSSNLCTEIAQNMSETHEVKEVITEDGNILITKSPGDLVVCNLFSINLPKVVQLDMLEEATKIAIRALDATVELNNLPLKQAEITNKKYRSLGLGALGWDELRVMEGLEWDSKEILEYVDELHEKINYYAIEASNELAAEKGSYSLFEGSDWQTGKYFELRGYFEGDNADKWKALAEKVARDGMRNAYLIAIAPNSTTSNILGTTASIDPVFGLEYVEEKSKYKISTVAPNITPENYQLYHEIAQQANQYASVRQNIVRQRHVDQAISFNLYIPNTIHAKNILELQKMAWEGGMKSIYYTRSTALKVEGCEWCHA